QRRTRGHEHHLPGGAAQQSRVALGAGERRGRRAEAGGGWRSRRPRRGGGAPRSPPPRPGAPPKPVRIDFDKLQQRIFPLPLPARAYTDLEAGRPGIVFVLEPAPGSPDGRFGPAGGGVLTRFDLKTRKIEKLADNVAEFDLSANGDKMLLRMSAPGGAGRGAPGAPPPVPSYVIVPSATPVKA